jgi:hypothetical protein
MQTIPEHMVPVIRRSLKRSLAEFAAKERRAENAGKPAGDRLSGDDEMIRDLTLETLAHLRAAADSAAPRAVQGAWPTDQDR